jgi:hypothetical protein
VIWDLLIELSSLSCGKEEVPETYCTYVEEADDDANKVSQRKRLMARKQKADMANITDKESETAESKPEQDIAKGVGDTYP